MQIVVGVCSLFLIAFLIHIILWRIKVPKRQVLAILQIFSGVFVLSVILLISTGIQSYSFAEFLHLGFFFFAVTMVYVVTYLGTKDVGPSFLMLKGLSRSNSDGLVVEDFYELVTNEYLIETRIRELLEGRLIEVAPDGKMKITKDGVFYSAFYTRYRKVLGIKEFGG